MEGYARSKNENVNTDWGIFCRITGCWNGLKKKFESHAFYAKKLPKKIEIEIWKLLSKNIKFYKVCFNNSLELFRIVLQMRSNAFEVYNSSIRVLNCCWNKLIDFQVQVDECNELDNTVIWKTCVSLKMSKLSELNLIFFLFGLSPVG